jgi:hypothetical protein
MADLSAERRFSLVAAAAVRDGLLLSIGRPELRVTWSVLASRSSADGVAQLTGELLGDLDEL